MVFFNFTVGIDSAKEAALLEELYDRIYGNFVEEVDAVDNGISAFDGTPRWVCGHMCVCMRVCVFVCDRLATKVLWDKCRQSIG